MGITANVSGASQITASVGETKIDVSVAGGVGPTGSSGVITVTAPVTNSGTSTSANIGLSVGAGLQVSGGSLVLASHTHTASQITDFTSAVIAAAPPTTNASLLTSGTLSASRLPASGVVAGSYSTVTVDATGRVTAGSTHAVSWDDVSGKPSTFTPSAHGHDPDDIVATQAYAFDAFTWASGESLPDAFSALSTVVDGKASSSHTHGNITNAGAIGSTSGLPIITTTSGVLTTGAFGTSAGQFCQGNDARLSNARTPTSHSHGLINNEGGLSQILGGGPFREPPVCASNAGYVVGIGSWGTTEGTYCQGNDARLSDARTPTAHKASHATGGTDALTAADIGAAASSHTHSAADVSFASTDRLLGRSSSGAGAGQEITCTSAGRALLDDADAAAQRTTLGLVAIASSGSASDLSTGTLSNARLTARVRASSNLYLWSAFR